MIDSISITEGSEMAGNLCDMCRFKFSSSNNFFEHMKLQHSISSKFHTKCKIRGCIEVFHLYSSFQRHWYKSHYHSNNQVPIDFGSSVSESTLTGMFL